MKRAMKILALRWARWWTEIALEIDQAQIAIHIPSFERNTKRLQRINFQLDQAHAPQSLIMQAVNRAAGK